MRRSEGSRAAGSTARRLERALDVLAYSILALVIMASVSRPHISGDSWAYHLPFSARLWNIGGDAGPFVLSNHLEQRFAGFPLLAEFLQGGLWKLTGSLCAVTLINSVTLVSFILLASRSKRLSIAILAFASLSVPLVAMHAASSYVDLFVGLCVCFQALAAERVCVGHGKAEPVRRWEALFVAAAAAAGNSKLSGLLASAAITAFVLGYGLWHRRGPLAPRLRRIVLVMAIASLVAGAPYLENVRRHANPVYPMGMQVLGVELPGTERLYFEYPTYTEPLGSLARPVNWLLSVTEIDWRIRGIQKRYAPDSLDDSRSRRFGRARTGGYWGALVIGTLALAFVLAALAVHRGAGLAQQHGFFLGLFAFLTLVGAFLPQSHELRYFLHWPLLLMVVVAVLVRAAGLRASTRVALAAAYLGTFVLSQQRVAYRIGFWPPLTQHAIVNSRSSAPEIEFASRTGGVCLGPEYSPWQFAYWSYFHGGTYGVEQGWFGEASLCTRFPRFERQPERR